MIKILNLIKSPLFSGSAIMVLGSNSVNALNYLYHLIMGRLLGPANYGELAALISLIGLLGMIPGSINLVVIKYISATKSEDKLISLVNWLHGKVFKVSLIFSLLIVVISPVISSFLHIEKIIYIILIAVSFLFSVSTILNRAILQGLLKFKEMILSLVIESGAKLVISIILIFLGFRVGGAILALVISVTIGWYLSSKFISFPSRKKFDIVPEIKLMISYTFPVLIYTIATTSLYSSDLLLVKHFFSSHDAGLYASLSTLGKIIFFGTGPIGSAMFPIVSQRHARGMEYRKIFLYSFIATIALSLGTLLIYWQFPKVAINILYGSAYIESANLLVWVGIFITLFTLSALYTNFNLSLGRVKVVVLPFVAAIAQIIIIWFYHKTLFDVILISIIVTALLLTSLLIYSIYVDKPGFNNRTRL